MKFGKRLQSQINQSMPEWRPHFIDYKLLKQSLKKLRGSAGLSKAADKQRTNPPLVDSDRNASSVAHAIIKDICRASASGGPPSVQELLLYRPPEDGVWFSGGGQVEESKSSEVDVSSYSALSSAKQVLQNGVLAVVGEAETTCEEFYTERKSKRAKLDDESSVMSDAELDFVSLLNKELNKMNVFFIEKEEEYVIRLQELKYRTERMKKELASNGGSANECGGNEELLRILRDIVTFHGEMVLLENYSSLNYTGLVKILKKHDKVTGTVLRLPFIQGVLLQPFFTTELLSKLVRECEDNLHSLFPVSPLVSVCRQLHQDASAQSFSADLDDDEEIRYNAGEAVNMIYRSTLVALITMEKIRHSSTRSIFSLPPMNRVDCESMHGFKIDERSVTPVAVVL